MAMVLRTGFSTAKGQLLRAILYPKPPKFDFEKQGLSYIWVLIWFLIIGSIITIVVNVKNGTAPGDIVLAILNIVTIAVPPALPLSLSIGLNVAFSRLKTKGIFTSSSRAVASAGRVNCLCFDKTGTLTEDGLTLTGVQLSNNGALGELKTNPEALLGKNLTRIASPEIAMSHVLAACHGVSLLEKDDLW